MSGAEAGEGGSNQNKDASGGQGAMTSQVAASMSRPVFHQPLWLGGVGDGGSREKSLQVDELVHQHQGARQAGQAGLGAATVTTRVAS